MLGTVMPVVEDAVDETAFRSALRLFASGVTVIATDDGEGGIHAMTATAFSSLSLKPPLVLAAVARDARSHKLIIKARRFGVSILDEDQITVARHFGKQGRAEPAPRFVSLDGAPVIEGAMARLACTLEDPMAGGDHSIFVGLVTAAAAHPGRPLLHFDGSYRTLLRSTGHDLSSPAGGGED